MSNSKFQGSFVGCSSSLFLLPVNAWALCPPGSSATLFHPAQLSWSSKLGCGLNTWKLTVTAVLWPWHSDHVRSHSPSSAHSDLSLTAWTLETHKPRFKSRLCHFLAVGLWGRCFTFLRLSLLTYKMKMLIICSRVVAKMYFDELRGAISHCY